jgi:hypothetical protein
VGCVAYLVFLLLAATSHWGPVMRSFLHAWQISLSISLCIGVWLGYYALTDLGLWLKRASEILKLSSDDSSALEDSTLKTLASPVSSVVALPLILGAIATMFLISRTLPSALFPYPAHTPAFVYSAFIELCLICVHLLGATGFWLLYVLTRAARRLSQLASVNSVVVDEDSMKPLSDTVLRLCFYLLLIIASGMPGVAIVVFEFKDTPSVLLLGTVFGMALPTLALTLSFFGPVYYLHRMLSKAKDDRTSFLKQQLAVCEDILYASVSKMKKSDATFLDPEAEKLLTLSQFLRDRLAENKRRSVWPFDLSSLLKLTASSALPVVTFFGEKVLRGLVS